MTKLIISSILLSSIISLQLFAMDVPDVFSKFNHIDGIIEAKSKIGSKSESKMKSIDGNGCALIIDQNFKNFVTLDYGVSEAQLQISFKNATQISSDKNVTKYDLGETVKGHKCEGVFESLKAYSATFELGADSFKYTIKYTCSVLGKAEERVLTYLCKDLKLPKVN
jgi:hypothetical protein